MFASYKKEYAELREHLIDSIGLYPRYATAFLTAYGRRMAKQYRKARAMSESVMESPGSGLAQTIFALNLIDLSIAFVAAAYRGYMTDLRRGKYVGTPVEKAIWAILDNRSDLLSDLDDGLAEYIGDHAEEKFPTLYGEVLRMDDPE